MRPAMRFSILFVGLHAPGARASDYDDDSGNYYWYFFLVLLAFVPAMVELYQMRKRREAHRAAGGGQLDQLAMVLGPDSSQG